MPVFSAFSKLIHTPQTMDIGEVGQDGILSLDPKDVVKFPGAVKVHVSYIEHKLLVDIVMPDGTVKTKEYLTQQ